MNGYSLSKITWCRGELLNAMAPSSPAPVNWWCHPDASKANESTTTGKRSRNNCCLELDDSIHISLSGSCMSATVFLNILPTHPPVNPSALCSSSPNSAESMPRLRQRMRCRRGSTRSTKRHSTSPSSSPSEISSPSDSLPRLLHGRLIRSRRRLDSPSSSALPAQSHTALFSFDSSLNWPRVSVAISVVFLEEPQVENPSEGQGPVGCTNLDEALHGSRGQPSGSKEVLRDDSGHFQANLVDNPSSKTVVHSDADIFSDRGEPEDYGCKIEEVAPDE